MASRIQIYAGLSPLELRFARHILKQAQDGDVNLTAAYDAVGYGGPNAKQSTRHNQASQIFKRPHVQAFVTASLERRLAAETCDRDYVIGTLMTVVDLCMTGPGQPNSDDSDKDGPAHVKPSASYLSVAVRSLELLGKATGGGIFTDRSAGEAEAPIPLAELYKSIGSTIAEIRTEHGQAIKIPAIIERKVKEHAKSSG